MSTGESGLLLFCLYQINNTCILLPFNSGLWTWNTNSVSGWCYLGVACLCFEGLHQLCSPTCFTWRKNLRNDGQIPHLFWDDIEKPISPPSPSFTCARIFNYTDFLFFTLLLNVNWFSGGCFLIWNTLKYFGDEASCISIRRIKGENMSNLCSWEIK